MNESSRSKRIPALINYKIKDEMENDLIMDWLTAVKGDDKGVLAK